jgi:hypothetical protein
VAVNSELASPLQVSSSGQVSVRRVLKLVLLRLSEAANSVQELQLPVLSSVQVLERQVQKNVAELQLLALSNGQVFGRQEPKPD